MTFSEEIIGKSAASNLSKPLSAAFSSTALLIASALRAKRTTQQAQWSNAAALAAATRASRPVELFPVHTAMVAAPGADPEDFFRRPKSSRPR